MRHMNMHTRLFAREEEKTECTLTKYGGSHGQIIAVFDPANLASDSKQFESTLITQVLQHTGGRRIEAATLLGMGRNPLTRKIQELGLDEGKAG